MTTMVNISDLLEKNNIQLDIPDKWGTLNIDDEDLAEYKYSTESIDGKTIHVFSKPSIERNGDEGKDEIIIDLEDGLISFINADGVLTQFDKELNITDETV